MKHMTLFLSLGLGILVVAGCGEVKRQSEQGLRGVAEHGLSKIVGSGTDKAGKAVDKSVDSATGADKKSKERDALKGNEDDSDK